MTSYKVSIVGARSLRQGTGPWFAKHFDACGADVISVLGRSESSAEEAKINLKKNFDIDCESFYNFDEMISFNKPDLLVIATPADTHRQYLLKALEYDLPTFVEKPFIWDDDRDNVKDVSDIVTAFEEKKLKLFVNTQWLETLDLFRSIYPDCDMNHIKSLSVNMSPSSEGPQMIVDALPHCWSLLCELAGEGDLQDIKVAFSSTDELTVEGRYKVCETTTEFRFYLKTAKTQPRSFSYAINGDKVQRIVDLSDYSMSFQSKNGTFPLEDPMRSRIRKILTLLNEKSYNVTLRQSLLETKLLKQSIKVEKL